MSERAKAVRSADLVEAAGSRISDGEEGTDSGAVGPKTELRVGPVLGAALRAGKIRPLKAECFAYPFNRARVEFVARAD